MQSGCPGAGNIKGAPSITVKVCPECGGEIELFSGDSREICRNCGFVVYNDISSCVTWCKYAVNCVGEELYDKVTGKGESERP